MTDEVLAQNLRDAGCSPATVRCFLQMKAEGKTQEMFQMLSRHRACLLCKMHELQKPIDNLDYLIYTLRQESEK